MKTEEDRRVHLRLPPDLYEDIRVTAKLAGVPVNWWIIDALDERLGFPPRKPRPRQLR